MTRLRAFAIAASAFLLASASVLLAQEYDIRLSHGTKTGDKYRVFVTANQSEKMTALVGNAAVRNASDEFAIELIASITTLAVNERGRETKSAIRIEKGLITEHGETKGLIPTGAFVIASLEGSRIVFTIDDAPVDPMTAKALGMALSSSGGGPTDDEVFGTSEKKKVGDSWPINGDLIAKSLFERHNISTSKEDIHGAATLEGIVKGGPQEYLVVSVLLDIGMFSVPLPNGFRVRDAEMRGAFSGKFPINQVRKPFGTATQMTGWFTATGSPDPKMPAMTIKGTLEQRRNLEIEHLE
jgi:hypothetical protein